MSNEKIKQSNVRIDPKKAQARDGVVIVPVPVPKSGLKRKLKELVDAKINPIRKKDNQK